MKKHRPLTLLVTVGLLAACSARAPGDGETIEASRAEVIAWDRTEVVVYRNDTDSTLPALVPVVISKNADRTPSAAFRIDCGANASAMIRGFGYRAFDPDFARRFDSLDLLTSELGAAPLVTLSCNGTPSSQITQIFRVIDADPQKGQSPYYARLRDDADGLYALGCFDFVRALGWDTPRDPAAWASSVPVAINRAVLDTWTADQKITPRELNCYADRAEAMPAVDASLPVTEAPAPSSDVASLYKVSYRFDGVSASVVPYLISNGKGYAIDCGSNVAGMESALAFPPEAPLSSLATSSPTFVNSAPGEQPLLRCENPDSTIFETTDESPPTRYFRFGRSKPRLIQFACGPTREFVAAGISDIRRVPKASIPYLVVDQDAPGPIKPLVVGCGKHDECAEHTASCSGGSRCVDDYAGYHCADCPSGYRSSDGYTCADIDECAAGTATCGPKTKCVNEVGGYRCDPTETTWRCWLHGAPQGTVTIWWGHQPNDAEWACNSWISACGNGGGCQATRL